MKLLIVLLLVFSCSKDVSVEKPIPKPVVKPTPVVKPIEYRFKWNKPEWDKYLVAKLKESKLIKLYPVDINEFGDHSDMIKFWGNILVEIAYWESKFDPDTYYKESFGLYSRGLFQLSLVDGKRYNCLFTTEKSVHDPYKNIDCAVKIFAKLIGQNNRIAGKVNGSWQGAARYFATLRGTRDYTAKALTAIKKVNKINK